MYHLLTCAPHRPKALIKRRMAENKRQNPGAKGNQNPGSASTAGGTTANMVPLEAALSGAIGAR